MKVVLLNGPSGSGKDTVADYLKQIVNRKRFDSVYCFSLAAPIKKVSCALLENIDANIDYTKKDKSLNLLNNKSLRELYIHLGESIREFFGQEYFINQVINNIETAKLVSSNPLIIISDLGLQFEHDAFAKISNPKEWTILNLKRTHCTFRGDSREYVKPNINKFAVAYIDNSYSLDNLKKKVDRFAYFAGLLDYD